MQSWIGPSRPTRRSSGWEVGPAGLGWMRLGSWECGAAGIPCLYLGTRWPGGRVCGGCCPFGVLSCPGLGPSAGDPVARCPWGSRNLRGSGMHRWGVRDDRVLSFRPGWFGCSRGVEGRVRRPLWWSVKWDATPASLSLQLTAATPGRRSTYTAGFPLLLPTTRHPFQLPYFVCLYALRRRDSALSLAFITTSLLFPLPPGGRRP
jgi:hypothetical protein